MATSFPNWRTGLLEHNWDSSLTEKAIRIAAYQAPLLPAGSMEALGLIRSRVEYCEAEGVTILCCPEAILGGLADYSPNAGRFAMRAEQLDSTLAPLASNDVTTIVGFTELADGGLLYNSAAVFERGSVTGVYRKLHPAIHHSIYSAGREVPVFHVGDLTFGIVLCNDSNYSEPAKLMALQGATALFIPTNNGLPHPRAGAGIVSESRSTDIARAIDNRMWVIRADVAGSNGELLSYGCSGIVDPQGTVVQSARQMAEDLVVAEIHAPRPGLT